MGERVGAGYFKDVGVSKNTGTLKLSILIGFSMILTIHFGWFSPYFWKHPCEA